MKILMRVFAAIVVCLAVLLLVLRVTGLEPHDRIPGLWLKGDLVTAPVTDWSFTDKVPTVEVQTRTWYLIPHSVTTYCVAYHGQLYLDSIYRGQIEYPHGRSWNENVARDPRVRIKIGNQLYDRTLIYVADPAEKERVLQAKAKKYPQQKIPANATVQIFRVVG